ncbi:LysM peptidoglycan-binding domain-containing protein [Vibrio salinus]|uniref:LysM peptidoglycan-binding domain-containing protein n=1 Tax=Vibrio salinus TaxID=2899784 RepID=UPI001E602190|nr:LysM peptidoglycan-binding domain-containing protein [Vibrio salinus]MCE0494402.1 LysM peptidoglycan-binding domain-containing protein [Vibrio salinus]
MKKSFSWAILLLLAGCQLTQSNRNVSSDSQKENITNTAVNREVTTTSQTGSAVETRPESHQSISPKDVDDLWQRISMQFTLPVPDNKKIDYYRTWYIKHPRHLETVAKRAEPFLYLITEKIEKRHMPLELALLPVVESAFDVFAYSYGRAAGLWQFVPGTGKLYGLKQNYWYDGRRDVNAATDAALDYFQALHSQFNNWDNAIAAYNSGEGRVARAIKYNKRKGKPTDFFSLSLPKETSSYVPKLLALADVIAHKEKYGLNLPKIANKPALQLVNPNKQLDLAIAAQLAGISVKELQSYNPGFNRWSTAPKGPYDLLIPVSNVSHFNHALKDYKGSGLKLVRYKVRSGDNLNLIAKKNNTTPTVIRKANALNSNLIRAGQYLMIPTSVRDEETYELSVANRLAKIQSRARGNRYKVSYTVRSGDSLWTIAKKHKVSYNALAKWNGMSPRDPLKVGKKLVVWKKSANGAIIRSLFYTIKNGDTLSEIASKFKVNISDIVKWNNLSNQKYIKPGQRIKLYVDVTKVSV